MPDETKEQEAERLRLEEEKQRRIEEAKGARFIADPSEELPLLQLSELADRLPETLRSRIGQPAPRLAKSLIKTFKKLEPTIEMYQDAARRGITLSELLEEEDPSENYRGLPRDKNGRVLLDAYDRQLALRDLPTSGPNAVTLDRFYTVPGNKVLFPEFINRNIRIGQMMTSLDARAEDLIADTIGVTSVNYTSVEANMPTGDEASYKDVKEGSQFPTVTMSLATGTVRLRKKGVRLSATYEYLSMVQANIFALILQFLGMQHEKDQAADAIDVMLNGNTGLSNPSPNTNVAVAGTLSFSDMIDLLLNLLPFTLRKIIVNQTRLKTLLTMAEFTDTLLGYDFPRTGKLTSPIMGASLMTTAATNIATSVVLGADTNFSLIRATLNGWPLTEAEKIINGQIQEIVISEYVAFIKLFTDATEKLTI